MPALLDIALRTAKTADQKVPESLLGARHVVARIHRSEHVIVDDLGIKRPNEPLESGFANSVVNVEFAYLHA